MCIFKKKVFVLYKEYRDWEDSDSNGTEIINVFSNKKKAITMLFANYNQELEFFDENKIKILDNECSHIGYYITSQNGDVEGYVVESEVS